MEFTVSGRGRGDPAKASQLRHSSRCRVRAERTTQSKVRRDGRRGEPWTQRCDSSRREIQLASGWLVIVALIVAGGRSERRRRERLQAVVQHLLQAGRRFENRAAAGAARIERLLHFMNAQGYRVVGEHEEEYVKGPGMMFSGDPEQYLTIIRLRVESLGHDLSVHDERHRCTPDAPVDRAFGPQWDCEPQAS